MQRLIDGLFKWWTAPSENSVAFAEDFEFVGVSAAVDADAWKFVVEQAVPPENVKVIGSVCAGDTGVIVFESTDPVTLLRHRTSWFVERHSGEIRRLVETTGVIET
jgi:hypothetical protein